MLTFNPDAAESLVALTDALYKNKNEWRTLLAFNPDAAESLVALTDALCKNRISVFYTWQRPNIKELLPRKILISLDSAFSWLFLLVCFDTKPLFLKVKKVKKRCSAGHRNLRLHTSSFGFYIWKGFLGLFTLPDFLHSFRLTSKSKYFTNQCKIELTIEERCILPVWTFTKRFFLDKDRKENGSSRNFKNFIVLCT